MSHPLLRLAPLFRSRLRLLGVCMALLFVATGLGLAGPWLIAQAIDQDLVNGDVPALQRTAALYLLVVLAGMAARYFGRVGIERVAQGAMLELKRQLFDHLLRHDLDFHDRHTPGRLITRVQGDTQALHVLFTEVILSTPPDIAMAVGVGVLLWRESPEVALMVGAVLPPYVLALLIFRKVAPPRFLKVRELRSTLTGFLAGHIRAMPTLRRFDREAWVRGRSDALNEEVYAADVYAAWPPVFYYNGLFAIRQLGFAAVLWGGGLMVARDTLTVGVLVMGMGYLRQLFNPLMRLSFHLTTLERARAGSTRIAGILDDAPTVVEPAEPAPWPGLKDAIRLEDVAFAYTPEAKVLKGLDMTIPAGSHVAVVGPTGGGKSTLLNLLMRFRDPTGGSITVDGVPLDTLSLKDLRQHVGLVLQDVLLFPGTILDNLGGDREKAMRACETLGLSIDLDDRVSAGGENLSRGERQLLTFARALVNDPEVLVLDEATSAVDPATEARVQAALEALRSGRTVITVAHRLATVRDCDRIFVLSGGDIVERGDHDALVAADGIYAALYQLQHPPTPGLNFPPMAEPKVQG